MKLETLIKKLFDCGPSKARVLVSNPEGAGVWFSKLRVYDSEDGYVTIHVDVTEEQLAYLATMDKENKEPWK